MTPVAPTGPAVIAGFAQVPITVEVVGTYANVTAFLNDVQAGTQRLLLVTGLDAKKTDAAEASGGRPATADGDLDLLISGSLYVLQDQAAAATPEVTDPATPPAPLPVPPGDKNPLAPIG